MTECKKDDLLNKIKIYNETLWEMKATNEYLNEWLQNFNKGLIEDEELYALYLLSNFMFFGSIQIRELIRSLFRDVYRYPIIEKIRLENNNATDKDFIDNKFNLELQKTIFFPIGNPSESGSHILYYFRQVNGLPKDLFKNIHEIFDKDYSNLRFDNSNKYIFVDDFCGTGSQLLDYGIFDLAAKIKALNKDIDLYYYSLFANEEGLEYIKKNSCIVPKTIFLMDTSYKCFESQSRYFSVGYLNIDKEKLKDFADKYGKKLFPGHSLGFKNCQLLLGFHHNTPDNSLPIFWSDLENFYPIFKRYTKNESWEII